MIKSLKKYQISITPFQTTKNWSLSNVSNDGVLLDENGNNIALEYISYDNTQPAFNYSCDIALEQQETDRVSFHEGLNLSGIFYPDLDPQNIDGTYKRLIYSQVKTMFYNNFKDPTKLLGIENIDFENSKTKRRLADKLRMFEIPTDIFGLTILPNSITIQDNLLDNTYIITDDGFNNLLAGNNLFSKQQEIGDFSNNFQTGSDFTCNLYFNILNPISGSIILTAAQFFSTSASVILNWTDPFNNEDGFIIERSIDSGSTFFPIISTGPDIITDLDTNVSFSSTYWYRVYAFNINFTSSYSNTASVTLFQMGTPYNLNSIITSSFIYDSSASYFSNILTWNNNPSYVDSVSLLKSTDGNSISFLTYVTNSISGIYIDYNINSTSSYQYQIENSDLTHSVNIYSNIASSSTPYLIYDGFGQYYVGQQSGYNLGSNGWNGQWVNEGFDVFVAVDTFEQYSVNQTNNFNKGYGWSNIWSSISYQWPGFSASESFEEYNIGQTTNYNGGIYWNGIWKLT